MMADTAPIVDYYSVCSIPVRPLCKQKQLSIATAFFYRINGGFSLVTNWHVVSGRNPETGQPLDEKYGAIPDCLDLSFHLQEMGQTAHHIQFPLFKNDGEPLWFQHKVFGQMVDVAVIKFGNDVFLEDANKRVFLKMYAANEGDPKHLAAEVGSDVFVVGYPLGLTIRTIFPVWKRGSIASEPAFDVDDLPLLYIDCATRKGMSGSPVYLRQFGQTRYSNGSVAIGGGVTTELIGVYSGRFSEEDEYGRQVGRVWKTKCIDDIVTNGVPGAHEIK